jgi:hypothetical protein
MLRTVRHPGVNRAIARLAQRWRREADPKAYGTDSLVKTRVHLFAKKVEALAEP